MVRDIKFSRKVSTIWVQRHRQLISIHDSEIEPDICDQSTSQLVLSREEYSKYGVLIGKKVRINGRAFGGISAQHFTQALISVEEIELKDK